MLFHIIFSVEFFCIDKNSWCWQRCFQLLVYADDVNMLGENLHTIRENTEILIIASKDIGLEVNSENTKYMITSHQRNQNIVIENLSFENV